MKTKSLIILIIFAFAAYLLFGCAYSGGVEQLERKGQGFIGEQLPEGDTLGDDAGYANQENPPNYSEAGDKSLYIRANTSVNIRSGAGAGYSSVGKMDKGDLLPYKGKDGLWYKTVYKEKEAYVSSLYSEPFELEKGPAVIEAVIAFGETLLGYPYVWGAQRYHWGNGKLNSDFVNGKFDCSSFTQYIYYMKAGVMLDLTTRTQVSQGSLILKEDIKRGDLLFFTNSSRRYLSGNERVGHVAVYLGGNYILHTASDHAVIEEISARRWNDYIAARRVL